jgi:hypothetical protein
MPKDWDEGNKRIEGIFGQIGLGNQDPEKIPEFVEAYEKAMTTAEVVKGKKKGVKFEDVINETETNTKPEDTEIVEEDESS